MLFKDFACSSKIKPAFVGSSNELTTSVIAKMKVLAQGFGKFLVKTIFI